MVHLPQKFVHSVTDNMTKCCKFGDCTISTFLCVLAKPYIGMYGLATIYAHIRKQKSYSNQFYSICSQCRCRLWRKHSNPLNNDPRKSCQRKSHPGCWLSDTSVTSAPLTWRWLIFWAECLSDILQIIDQTLLDELYCWFLIRRLPRLTFSRFHYTPCLGSYNSVML